MANSVKGVRKAVIPAAGFGTRFLPATKAQPKEMLPIVDKPIIQYVVEGAVEAGIEQIIMVTGWHKRAIEDHFDKHFELEARLEKDGKTELLEQIRKISELANFVYVRQKEALGNGHAVLTAREIVGDEPFLVMWGDEFFQADPCAPAQLISAYEKYGKCAIAGVRIPKEDVHKYGIADVSPVEENIFKINKIFEKPEPAEAPSDLATHGSYLFTPDIFEILENLKPAKSGEIWLADAIDQLIAKRDVYAVELVGAKYYDCGDKVSYLKAVIDHGLSHPDTASELREYLKGLDL
ncbi:UTP--glucose-1-phosphate uridylyltransferase [Candidatus Curtissbacteria bacterium RIFCSPHIGHO2_01_FULL_41_11]|uniref:UTP--glucose-1-phosphate uridylyltransferase n=1 Tax=Candidatus Curtissbacteria bacterium RIFCSPHIGHO2_01_FULL_41_11 TaxID=1797711 RepID=A0A1F5G5A3_9BACT|nr:MAG: UTP--glucose-1-phosphate uridylyltransferase [Candidatus Curtissbacteria bacterium RIFCSPHIGHO2_01_FULL_41_11]